MVCDLPAGVCDRAAHRADRGKESGMTPTRKPEGEGWKWGQYRVKGVLVWAWMRRRNKSTEGGSMTLPLDPAGARAMPSAPATHERSQSPLSPPCRVSVGIAGVCLDLLARQHERNVRIMSGEEE